MRRLKLASDAGRKTIDTQAALSCLSKPDLHPKKLHFISTGTIKAVYLLFCLLKQYDSLFSGEPFDSLLGKLLTKIVAGDLDFFELETSKPELRSRMKCCII